ncbi:ATP-binding cassette domain-containing protein [Rhodococcus qingshengii]|uniref:ATP-binding cassette domain-containing protein n=1 Tax=Rhodococcus qingshengii TaxID=334542 RepID=UPI0036DB48EC
MNACTTTPESHVRRFDETELVAAMRSVDRKYVGVDALSDVSFEIGRNKIYGLHGRNGAGKTTIMRTMTGLLDHFAVHRERAQDLHRRKPEIEHVHDCGSLVTLGAFLGHVRHHLVSDSARIHGTSRQRLLNGRCAEPACEQHPDHAQ